MNTFDTSNIVEIADLVKDQFPQFYQQQGEDFVQFIKAYYEWLQQPDQPVGQARSRYKQFDIDTASQDFLEHYKQKYMWGLPPDILGNQRLLQKHILELYRSKGSQQAIRLLFRLLFNADIDFYIPSYDIFTLSDNIWIQPKYLEVINCPDFVSYINKNIIGSQSGATAVVESFEQRFVNGNREYILFISNIFGTFIPGESILYEGIDPINATKIVGSTTGVSIIDSRPGMQIGTILTATIGQFPVKVVVSGTYTATGTLDFTLENPGSYYSMDAVINVISPSHIDYLIPVANTELDAVGFGFPKDPDANLSSYILDSLYIPGIDNVVPDNVPLGGSDAEIRILSIANTHPYTFVSDMIDDYLSVDLDDTYPFPADPTSNSSTIIDDSLTSNTITVGSIDQFEVVNPGSDYSADVWFIPIDPYTSTSGIIDENGDLVGKNALIIGHPVTGENIAGTVDVIDSGFNNLPFNEITFVSTANTAVSLTGKPLVGGMGWGEGHYDNTKSFLSDDKYLYDGHYYQYFSYVIRAATTLDNYIDILKQLAHPAGNAVFADIGVFGENRLNHEVVDYRFVVQPV